MTKVKLKGVKATPALHLVERLCVKCSNFAFSLYIVLTCCILPNKCA